MSHADTLSRYLCAFIDSLEAAGVDNVCLCPGSRSTPLALLFAQHPRIRIWMHLDERSCSYFALGMAKASGKPVAILCTSGTAAFNFAPAVAEAYLSQVPLIVLTADRPQELRDLGANQTIDQVRLYGSHVKWFVEMPLPEATDDALRYASIVAARAVATATEDSMGPVHINLPLREPLVPAPYQPYAAVTSAARVSSAVRRPSQEQLDSLLDDIGAAKRGLIICGQQDDAVFGTAVTALSARLGYPIAADVLSQVRGGGGDHVIAAYDAFLRDEVTVQALEPDLILRFGAAPTSKPLATYLSRYRACRQVLVSPSQLWRDPDLTADAIVYADATALCQDTLFRLNGTHATLDESWLPAWQEAEKSALAATGRVLAADAAISEPSVIRDLAEVLPDGAAVFAGNSMPVRDLDSFYPASSKPVRMLASRGVSGIDGVTSAALGASTVLSGRMVLVIGDLSFYHDMNGLLAARRFGLDATIVLVNNDGGGIFSFLSQHEDPERFEELFGTPHGLDFKPVAQLYGLDYIQPQTREAYRGALLESFARPGVSLIEVKTEREANLALHRNIWREVAADLAASR